MKIGINGLAIGKGMTGIGSYTLDIVNSLEEFGAEHSYCVIAGKGMLERLDKKNWKLLVAERADRWWEELHLPGELACQGVDLYHSPLFTCPIVDEIPSVITIHDMIPEKRPDLCSESFLSFYKTRVYPSLRAAVKVVTTSEFSKREIIESLKVESEKIHVIYQGISPDFNPAQGKKATELKQRLKLPEKYILYVGICDERKNLRRLVSAFGRIAKEISDVFLVIAGRKDDGAYSLADDIESLGMRSRIVETGYVAQEDLPVLYAGAEVFAFPSLYEGFGRPVVEAMACGVPVVTSQSSSLPEIAEEAALLVDPMEVDSIAQGLINVCKDKGLRKKMREDGIKRAENFTYRKFGERLLEFYKQMDDFIKRENVW